MSNANHVVELLSSSQGREDDPTQSVEGLSSRLDSLWIEAREVDKQYAQLLATTPDDHDALVRVQGEMDRIDAEIGALEEKISDKAVE